MKNWGWIILTLCLLVCETSQTIVAQTSNEIQTLMVASSPEGASVFINDNPMGVTPYQLRLRPGNYKLKVYLKGYFEYEEIITLEKGDEAQAINITMRAKPAFLTIKTADDVEVSIDGEQVSVGSYQTEISPGKHKVEFNGELYKYHAVDVRLAPEEKRTLSYVPEKRFGELEIITRPRGATLYLNGKNIGESPNLINEVKVGRNIVEATLDGYAYERRTVVVENVRTTVVKIKLNKVEVKQPEIVKDKTPVPKELKKPKAWESDTIVILPLSEKAQEKRDRRYEIRNPFSWRYHDVAVNYIRGISGNGVELAYLNKLGGYIVLTSSPARSYTTYGGGIMIREYVFGNRNRGGFYMFGGAGKEISIPGYYWEIGQLVNLGRVTLSFGVSQVNFKTFLHNSSENEYLPYNDLKVRFGIGVSF